MTTRQIDTVIVGGGQAGLAMSYYLKQEGRERVAEGALGFIHVGDTQLSG